MNDNIDTARIKKLFYQKLEAEKRVRKPVPLKMLLIAAVIVCLSAMTVLAAQQGAFGAIFRNFGDVSGYVRESGVYVNDSGITMRLANYLADDRGIILELVFTRDDGGVFDETTMPFAIWEERDWFSGPLVSLGGYGAFPGVANYLSDDGRTLHAFVMANHQRDLPDVSSLDIHIDRLVFGGTEDFISAEIDFYEIFTNSEVIVADELSFADIHSDIFWIFDDVPALETPIVTDFGAVIDKVVFASAGVDESTVPLPSDRFSGLYMDGIDTAAMHMYDWNNLVGIRFTRRAEIGGREYDFNPRFLTGGTDFFGQRRRVDNYAYHFFRVADFEDLQDIGGIDFMVQSRNYLTGNWRIQTTFEANRETTRLEPNMLFETANPNVFIALKNVEISLLSTAIGYDVVDVAGRRISDQQRLNSYFWSGRMPHEGRLKLLYDNGDYLDLSRFFQAGTGMLEDNLITAIYKVQWNDFNSDTFTLMNTNRLQAVVIAGEVFEVD